MEFYSSGKLLISGEYVVLDGAKALALPTTYGQYLEVSPIADNSLIWESLTNTNTLWYTNRFKLEPTGITSQTEDATTTWLVRLLNEAKKMNPHFLTQGAKVVTRLTFPRDWGLGSSSTLINNIAQWAEVDPFKLSDKTFGGSGYDIACANAKTALCYQLIHHTAPEGTERQITPLPFNPAFKAHLYFVFLNNKQNSREGIAQYKTALFNKAQTITQISQITHEIIQADTLEAFSNLLERHEQLIGGIIKQQPVKERLFSDFSGSVKSLGAWGGDFVLACSQEDPTAYFVQKGFNTVIPFEKMIL